MAISLSNSRQLVSRVFNSIAFFFFLLPIVSAQPKFNFEYLDISNGLNHNTVFAIIQDRNGFIWLGTQDGLIRYDSKNTKIYNNNTDSTFQGKNIQSLVENKQGDLFIGTRGDGIIVKSGRTGQFVAIGNEKLAKALSDSWIKHLMIDNNQRLWISTLGNGLWVYDQKDNSFQSFSITKSILNSKYISSTVQDKEGNIWIASSSDNLYVVEKNTLEIKEFQATNTKFYGFRKTLYCDSRGRVWLGTEGHGLFLIDYHNEMAKSYSMKEGLSSNTITHLVQWQDNHLLIATDGGGLNILDVDKQKFSIYKSYDGKFPLNTNALYFLSIDRDKNLWIGTYNGGVNISKSNKMTIATYHFDERISESKSVMSILSIARSSSNKLWLGTDGDGVYEFDLLTKSFTDKREILGSKTKIIKTIFEDSKQNLWIGVFNEGLIKYNLTTKQQTKYFPNENPKTSINGWNVWSIAEDREGKIWVGTLGGGLNKIDLKSNEIISFVHSAVDSTTISGDGIMVVEFDHNDNIWVGTNTNGLNVYDRKTNIFKRFYHNNLDSKSISANDIRAIYQDRKNRVWVGTESGGLNLMLADQTFKHYKMKDGLISNAILGIVEDNEENLWLSSFNGITRLDVDRNTFQNFNFHKNYSYGTNQFNMMSAYVDSSYIAFGGINGLTLLKPNEFIQKKEEANVLFTDFKIFNKSADTSKMYDVGLKTHCNIERADKITLSYAENTFSIEFIAIDFVNADNIRYEYKMQGFDQSWRITNDQQREVNYTNLNPGTYTFKVKAYSQPGQSSHEKQIIITILALYWQTWWFKLGVTFLSIGLISFIFFTYLRNREMTLKQKVLESNELVLKITNEKLITDQEILNLKNEKLETDIFNNNSELLSQTAKIAHKNEVLQDIKKLLGEIDDNNEKAWPRFLRNLKSLVDSELEDKKNWARFQKYFDQTNQNFSKNLLATHPELTQTDLLICTLSKLNLSNKEMALLLNLSLAGIEKSRYRLKKRLNLSISVDLNSYLRSM